MFNGHWLGDISHKKWDRAKASANSYVNIKSDLTYFKNIIYYKSACLQIA